MDSKTFRERLPEFSDTEMYPDPAVNLQLTVAEKMILLERWGDMWEFGVCWWAAHYLVLGAQAEQITKNGGIPTGATGIVASKSVDGVSISYNTLPIEQQWDLTNYGRQLMSFARLVGAGGRQM